MTPSPRVTLTLSVSTAALVASELATIVRSPGSSPAWREACARITGSIRGLGTTGRFRLSTTAPRDVWALLACALADVRDDDTRLDVQPGWRYSPERAAASARAAGAKIRAVLARGTATTAAQARARPAGFAREASAFRWGSRAARRCSGAAREGVTMLLDGSYVYVQWWGKVTHPTNGMAYGPGGRVLANGADAVDALLGIGSDA